MGVVSSSPSRAARLLAWDDVRWGLKIGPDPRYKTSTRLFTHAVNTVIDGLDGGEEEGWLGGCLKWGGGVGGCGIVGG